MAQIKIKPDLAFKVQQAQDGKTDINANTNKFSFFESLLNAKYTLINEKKASIEALISDYQGEYGQQKKQLEKEKKAERVHSETIHFINPLGTNLNFNIHAVPGDGNCLFHAIADQLNFINYNAAEHTAATLRALAVHQYNSNPNNNQFETADYIYKMSQEGVWGGETEISMLSLALGIHITVYHAANHAFLPSYGQDDQPKIYLYFNGDNHYNSLRSVAPVEVLQQTNNDNNNLLANSIIKKEQAVMEVGATLESLQFNLNNLLEVRSELAIFKGKLTKIFTSTTQNLGLRHKVSELLNKENSSETNESYSANLKPKLENYIKELHALETKINTILAKSNLNLKIFSKHAIFESEKKIFFQLEKDLSYILDDRFSVISHDGYRDRSLLAKKDIQRFNDEKKFKKAVKDNYNQLKGMLNELNTDPGKFEVELINFLTNFITYASIKNYSQFQQQIDNTFRHLGYDADEAVLKVLIETSELELKERNNRKIADEDKEKTTDKKNSDLRDTLPVAAKLKELEFSKSIDKTAVNREIAAIGANAKSKYESERKIESEKSDQTMASTQALAEAEFKNKYDGLIAEVNELIALVSQLEEEGIKNALESLNSQEISESYTKKVQGIVDKTKLVRKVIDNKTGDLIPEIENLLEQIEANQFDLNYYKVEMQKTKSKREEAYEEIAKRIQTDLANQLNSQVETTISITLNDSIPCTLELVQFIKKLSNDRELSVELSDLSTEENKEDTLTIFFKALGDGQVSLKCLRLINLGLSYNALDTLFANIHETKANISELHIEELNGFKDPPTLQALPDVPPVTACLAAKKCPIQTLRIENLKRRFENNLASKIANGLKENTSLVHLSLSHNDIRADEFNEIVSSYNGNASSEIATINFHANRNLFAELRIDSERKRALQENLQNLLVSNRLVQLQLSYTGMSYEILNIIRNVVENNVLKLSSLTLFGNRPEEIDYRNWINAEKAIFLALLCMGSLSINYSYGQMLDDNFFDDLVDNMRDKKTRGIDLSICLLNTKRSESDNIELSTNQAHAVQKLLIALNGIYCLEFRGIKFNSQNIKSLFSSLVTGEALKEQNAKSAFGELKKFSITNGAISDRYTGKKLEVQYVVGKVMDYLSRYALELEEISFYSNNIPAELFSKEFFKRMFMLTKLKSANLFLNNPNEKSWTNLFKTIPSQTIGHVIPNVNLHSQTASPILFRYQEREAIKEWKNICKSNEQKVLLEKSLDCVRASEDLRRLADTVVDYDCLETRLYKLRNHMRGKNITFDLRSKTLYLSGMTDSSWESIKSQLTYYAATPVSSIALTDIFFSDPNCWLDLLSKLFDTESATENLRVVDFSNSNIIQDHENGNLIIEKLLLILRNLKSLEKIIFSKDAIGSHSFFDSKGNFKAILAQKNVQLVVGDAKRLTR